MGYASESPGEPLHWQPVPRPTREQLVGRRILLRPVQAATDAEPLFRVSHPPLGDPSIWTYLFDGPYDSAGALREHLERVQALEDPLYFTLVRLPEYPEGPDHPATSKGEAQSREEVTGAPQGLASYLRITPEHGVIEIGHIWLGTPLQRTAAATEAIYLLLHNAFDRLGYRRVEWKCDARNSRSRRSALRFGFRFEGIFRQHMVIKDRNRDTAWYAITDREWPVVREAFEAWLAPENFDSAGHQRRRLGDLRS